MVLIYIIAVWLILKRRYVEGAVIFACMLAARYG